MTKQNEDATIFWSEFKTEFAKLVNSTDISEFKGDNETNSWGNIYYDCKLKPLGVNKKKEFTYSDPEDFIPYIRISYSTGDLREFISPKRTPEQVLEDIYTIEAIFDEITKLKFDKVYCDDESVNIMAGEPHLASTNRSSINNDIYYKFPNEKTKDLSALSQPHIIVDISTKSYGDVNVYITVKQLP